MHLFIERKNYHGVFAPGYVPWQANYNPPAVGLVAVDHIVGNVELGKMTVWAQFYREVMGFTQLVSFDDKDIY